MKNTQAQVKALAGLYEKLPQPQDGATELTNWTVDKYTGGWDNRIGYERYNPIPSANFQPFSSIGRIDSLCVFSRHQGAQQSILFESAGTLYHLVESLMFLNTVDSGRTEPSYNEAPTQYVEYGRWIIVLNGYDQPFKYAAWPFYRNANPTFVPFKYNLGWPLIPAPPNPWGIHITPSDATTVGQNVCIFFDATSDAGLGIPTADAENKYKWKMSFINNAGAESPISSDSEEIFWTTGGAGNERKYAAYIEIPTGPGGTVARRLYRTKNYAENGAGTESSFYFVKDINNNTDLSAYDAVPDGALASLAPGITDSISMPSTGARFGAAYKDCLFIDGGADNDTLLFYSKPTKPDQYEALSFIETGNRNAGGITGLYSYFNFLLVIRENGIDAITGDYPNFSVSPISTDVGTRAINTITNIPGVGIAFLADDGIYMISSNMEYSDSPGIKNVSVHMLKTMQRINPDCIGRASAVYSSKWKEWHCYFPADGKQLPSLGVIYHVEKNAFSVREGFPVGALDKDFYGNIYFGHNQGTDAGGSDPQAGIFVVSGRRALGQEVVDEAIVDKAPPTATFRSPWMDMGDETIKKSIHYVYLYVLTQGSNAIAMDYFKDFSYSGTTSPSMSMQRADHTNQSIYGTATVDTGSETPWEEPFATPIRYPIAQGSCSHFQFKISTTNDMVLVGYAVEFTASGKRMITGKRTT